MTLPALAQLAVTGCGHVVGPDCDSTPVLKSRKMRKFMGRQDELAVIAAVRAVEAAALPKALGERCGLYLSVGFIPFEACGSRDARRGLDCGGSVVDGAFFDDGVSRAEPAPDVPLPAEHAGVSRLAQSRRAGPVPGWVSGHRPVLSGPRRSRRAALDDGTIDLALVGGVADQDNVLVQHHFSRIDGPIHASTLTSAAGFLVLERQADADRRGAAWRARPIACEIRYRPADPFEVCGTHEERTASRDASCDVGALGPASLAVALSTAGHGNVDAYGPQPRSIRGLQRMGDRVSHRVVVTGMGVVAPIGRSVGELVDGLLSGRTGAGPISTFDPAALPTRIAAEVKWAGAISRDRKMSFAAEAARQAVDDASTCGSTPDGGRRPESRDRPRALLDGRCDREDSRGGPPTAPRERLTFLQTPSDLCVSVLAAHFALTAPPARTCRRARPGPMRSGGAARMIRAAAGAGCSPAAPIR